MKQHSDICIEHKTNTNDATFPYHRHAECEIYFFIQGNIRFYVEGSCFLPAPDSLIILNPAEMHRIQSLDTTNYERITIAIEKKYMEQLSHVGMKLYDCFFSRPLGKYNLHMLSFKEKDEFLHLCKKIEENISDNTPRSLIKRDSYVSLLLVLIDEICSSNNSVPEDSMPDYIRGAMQYMEQHLDAPFRLSNLVDYLHVDASYLSKQFKLHTGLTMRDYFLDRKIAKAKSLLKQGANVTNTCYDAGFNDYSNFIRSFTIREGISPGKYSKEQTNRS